ncbi:reverse transcriptase domain-containing protein [Embleya sp. NPDC050154]|uniref:RNA-directed DNA polymerase n=1 Tax=Embleya sp. NPDC050154 TaxID=3363988 RepID=UPI0037B6F1F4
MIDIVDYPKDEINVRPLSRLSVRDHLIFDALSFSAAPLIDQSLSSSVYSYRWSFRRSTLNPPIESWRRMRRRGYSELENKSTRLAITDATSFYEHVDVETLADDLEALGLSYSKVKQISIFLDCFRSTNQAWGIPQGPDGSGVLANLYLAPVDEQLRQLGLRFVRYSDDINIFGQDWEVLRSALLAVNSIFRTRRLSLSAPKTQILENTEALSYYDDSEKNAINYGIYSRDRRPTPDLHRYFDTVIGSERPSARDLKFALNRLAMTKDDYGIHWVQRNLKSFAHCAKECFGYLSNFPAHQSTTSKVVANLLAEHSLRDYPHLQQRLLRYVLKENVIDFQILEASWEILKDRNCQTFPREFAARYIGRFGDYVNGPLLKAAYETEEDTRIKRALMIAMYESGYQSSRLILAAGNTSPNLRHVSRYLLSSPSIPLPA